MRCFAALTLGAVLLATVILAVLGDPSPRHREASAELLFREQARDMAAMAAGKIEITIVKSEEECLMGRELLLREPTSPRGGPRPRLVARTVHSRRAPPVEPLRCVEWNT